MGLRRYHVNVSTLVGVVSDEMRVPTISPSKPLGVVTIPAVATDLVQRAQAGDMQAYEELYREHVGAVYAVCLRMTADRDRAQDATQQAFVNVWRHLKTFDGKHFAAWVKRIAVNAVLSEVRSQRRRREESIEEESSVELQEPTRPVAISDTGLDLEAAIRMLPDRARAVFVLHDVEGYRHHEIATMLDVAEGTSKAQLHRARKLLREVLQR